MSPSMGRRAFNGVAILAKRPFEVQRGLPGDPDDAQARYIEAVIPAARGVLRLACIYLPTAIRRRAKIAYKLAFMDRLIPTRAVCSPRGAAGAGRRLQRHSRASRRSATGSVDQGRAVPARDARQVPPARGARLHRCVARRQRRERPLHLLGLSGRRLAAEQRHPHRPCPAVAAGGRRLETAVVDKDMRGRDKASDQARCASR